MSHVPGKRNQMLGCITPIISRLVQRLERFLEVGNLRLTRS